MSDSTASLPLFPFKRPQNALVALPEYAALRARDPISKVRMWDGSEAWVFTRWQDVRDVLGNNDFSADAEWPGYPSTSPARAAELSARKTFINMDPPDHTRLRRMLTREFMVKRISALRPLVEELVDDLLDDLERHGSGSDFVEVVAKLLPSSVISVMLGVPRADFDKLGALSVIRNDHTASVADINASTEEMLQHLCSIIDVKMATAHEDDDVLSRLIVEQVIPGHLTRLEAARMAVLLYVAGHETTTNQMGLGLLSFLIDDEQRNLLMHDNSLVPNAVEEMLRHSTITHLNSARVAKVDVEIGGHTIRAGEAVYPLVAAANRDPAVFENAHKFDISRINNPHVAFSYGIHQCLGQPLARLELSVFFAKIFAKFPSLRLAIPYSDVNFNTTSQTLHVVSLPVAWDD